MIGIDYPVKISQRTVAIRMIGDWSIEFTIQPNGQIILSTWKDDEQLGDSQFAMAAIKPKETAR